jgi:hypothetical protein
MVVENDIEVILHDFYVAHWGDVHVIGLCRVRGARPSEVLL